MLFFLLGLTILFAASLIMLLSFYLKMKKVNIKLHRQQQENELQRKKLEETNSELVEAKNHAEKISGYKSEFLANISHEIRTPLNAITGYIYLLQKQLDPDNKNTYIHNILTSSENLGVIINDLLDISKIEAGKMVIEQLCYNPVTVVTQVMSTLKYKAEEKNIAVELHLDPMIPDHLLGDPYRLSQILTNLVNNAIKFSESGQEVTINVNGILRNDIYELNIGVVDRGIGIEETKLANIFESFAQISSNTARNQTGTGMGLAIVKRLIELQKGSITVDSKVNEGSKFKFTIPYSIAPPEMVIKKKKNTDNAVDNINITKRVNILLVEDNEINQELAVDTINSWNMNFNIDIAQNGMEAIDMHEKNNYDIILMDIMMPLMDGNEATIHIRKKMAAPKCNIPIIGMTAHALPQEKHTAMENGMNEYVTKPFNPRELKQKIIDFTEKE